jgi:hypothetical protein
LRSDPFDASNAEKSQLGLGEALQLVNGSFVGLGNLPLFLSNALDSLQNVLCRCKVMGTFWQTVRHFVFFTKGKETTFEDRYLSRTIQIPCNISFRSLLMTDFHPKLFWQFP